MASRFVEEHYFSVEGDNVLFLGNPDGSMDNKFNRVTNIGSRYEEIKNKVMSKITDVQPPTPTEYNLAVAFLVLMRTGIRIGNETSAEGFHTDYKEKGETVFAKTYGLTTLKQEHVRVKDGIVHLHFTGKKHVDNEYMLDESLSRIMIKVINSGYNPVFGISESELTKFIQKMTSPYLSSKDFRTFRANVYAYQKIEELGQPKNEDQYDEYEDEVYLYVSEFLNNTPQVVKRSYIDPHLIPYVWGDPDEMKEENDE